MKKSAGIIAALTLGVAALAQSAPAKQEPPPEPKVKVGDTAPDFTLVDQNRKEVKLSGFRGQKNVVLAFYVFAFTGG
jgi:cytochrome oxidase Cu insertion factor (SCO1/SenC/PrrC family)